MTQFHSQFELTSSPRPILVWKSHTMALPNSHAGNSSTKTFYTKWKFLIFTQLWKIIQPLPATLGKHGSLPVFLVRALASKVFSSKLPTWESAPLTIEECATWCGVRSKNNGKCVCFGTGAARNLSREEHYALVNAQVYSIRFQTVPPHSRDRWVVLRTVLSPPSVPML